MKVRLPWINGMEPIRFNSAFEPICVRIHADAFTPG